MDILIVKISAIGDVIQCFDVLEYLREKFPNCNIDWVVSKPAFGLVSSHPLVRKAICFDFNKKFLKNLKLSKIGKFYKELRCKSYDVVFDLQGNCKSGLITLCSKAKDKVGFGFKTVSEWPNIFATFFQYNPSKGINIKWQYLQVIQKYFRDEKEFVAKNRLLNIDKMAKKQIELILKNETLKNRIKILVSPSSRWKNKELGINTLSNFLSEISENLTVSYLFLWGTREEKRSADYLHSLFKANSTVLDRLELSTLQNLIHRLDIVIAMDSCILHLTGSANTPSFSVFGPTLSHVYKPPYEKHLAYQGKCPKGKVFVKRCPLLRSCSTPICMQGINYKDLYALFSSISFD